MMTSTVIINNNNKNNNIMNDDHRCSTTVPKRAPAPPPGWRGYRGRRWRRTCRRGTPAGWRRSSRTSSVMLSAGSAFSGSSTLPRVSLKFFTEITFDWDVWFVIGQGVRENGRCLSRAWGGGGFFFINIDQVGEEIAMFTKSSLYPFLRI